MNFNKPRLLLVEGSDEVNFFDALCEHWGIVDIETVETGGKDKFKIELPTLLNAQGFENVEALGIVRDADLSSQSAVQSIQSSIRKYNLPIPPGHNEYSQNETIKVGIYIMPGNRDSGMLESLVLDTVEGHPVRICSDAYIESLRDHLEQNPDINFPRNVHKARLQAYLAGMEKFIPGLGLAAKKGYFDLDSPALDEIKSFLVNL